MTSQIYLQAIWNIECAETLKSLDNFIKEWDLTLKKCNCDEPNCKHYEKEKEKRFGKKIEKLFNRSLLMNAISFKQTLRQVH